MAPPRLEFSCLWVLAKALVRGELKGQDWVLVDRPNTMSRASSAGTLSFGQGSRIFWWSSQAPFMQINLLFPGSSPAGLQQRGFHCFFQYKTFIITTFTWLSCTVVTKLSLNFPTTPNNKFSNAKPSHVPNNICPTFSSMGDN